MIKRALAALAAATVALTLLGAPAAQAADTSGPTGKPKTDCVWMWTVQGPTCHWQ
ncbi:hypothetical protein [Amycolatopsis sp. cmx-4-68]|uniref:hypothetical protein n=1 Tax=Amycolatopsis sp. cmx-4-68 TaxID=2790938 RepID=UPI00397E42F9